MTTRRQDANPRSSEGGTMRLRRINTLAILLAGTCFRLGGQDHTSWREYAGGADSAQYSGLKQIDRSNVSRLEIAWTYPTGDGMKYSFNPIMVNGLLYVLAKKNSIV